MPEAKLPEHILSDIEQHAPFDLFAISLLAEDDREFDDVDYDVSDEELAA